MSSGVDLVKRFHGLRALVIGDAMLDTYLEGVADRLCSEGPVPVVRKTGERRVPGGAANTAANLHALDADVSFLGIVGRDHIGAMLLSSLREQGINTDWVIEDEYTPTQHKIRILANGQYVVRFDENACPPSLVSQRQLITNLDQAFSCCDLVVLSDYGYGTLSEELIDQLRALRSIHSCVLLIDSKDMRRFRNIGATVITPNYREAQLLVDPGLVDDTIPSGSGLDISAVEHIGKHVLSIIDTEHVAITMAGNGVLLLDRHGMVTHLPTHPIIQAHDVGAGDSFAAAMALALAAGGSAEEAARVAIDAASIAITKRWTAVVHHQELLQRVSLREHASLSLDNPSLAEAGSPKALSQLIAHLDAERLRGRTIVFTNGVFDILHAGHIHLLRQAKELADILVVGINSDTSTRRLKGKHRPINSERDRMALVAALDAVDHVVLFDEDTPTELLRLLRPHIHVKGGDYANEAIPEAEVVQASGGRVVILPLVGSASTTGMIDRIVATTHTHEIGVEL